MGHVSVRLDDEVYEMLEEKAKALKVPKRRQNPREEKKILEEYENKPLEGTPHKEADECQGYDRVGKRSVE